MISANQAVQVGLGNGSGNGGSMVIEAQDRFDLGDRSGGNDITWIDGTGAGSTLHDIDGGPGAGNELNLLGGIWFWQRNGSAYDLYKVNLLNVLNPSLSAVVIRAGTFQRIQTVTTLGIPLRITPEKAVPAVPVMDTSVRAAAATAIASADTTAFNPASLVTHLNGTATTVQTAASGTTVLAADGTSDVTYAGPGTTSLTSSASHALLVYSKDTSMVTVTDGTATIASDGSTGGTVTIDTGNTRSVVIGGASAQIIRGHLAGATFEAGTGDSTVIYTGARSAYMLTTEADGATTVSDTAGIGTDRLVGIQHVAFADQSVDLANAPVAAPAPSFAMTDVTAAIASVTPGEGYSGPVSYLQKQFIYTGADQVAVAAQTGNVFLKGSTGDDALAVSSGSNVLDGGLGSNFLVGASGTDGGVDTFYIDGRSPGVIWSTVVNFHHGDAVTLWGFKDGTSTKPWTALDGAQGYQGATIHSELGGVGTGVNASVTFAGVSRADAQTKFTTSVGSIGGNSYLSIMYTG